MQLVEQGRIGLDSPDDVERLAPELALVKVLSRGNDGILNLCDKNSRITLRMLLNHTGMWNSLHFEDMDTELIVTCIAGFGYAFEDSRYSEWAWPIGIQDFSGFAADTLMRPLVNQPGTKFQYGTSVDWAGVLVERLTQLSLEEYFHRFIFEPLDVKGITFFPNETQMAQLAFMHQRGTDDHLKIRDHIYRYPLLSTATSDIDRFCMGGGGCFGQPTEFCSEQDTSSKPSNQLLMRELEIIAMLLNNGADPKTGTRLLKSETIGGSCSKTRVLCNSKTDHL